MDLIHVVIRSAKSKGKLEIVKYLEHHVAADELEEESEVDSD